MRIVPLPHNPATTLRPSGWRIFAAIIFGQPLTLIMILGLVLIIGGVLTVEMGSQAAIRKREANA